MYAGIICIKVEQPMEYMIRDKQESFYIQHKLTNTRQITVRFQTDPSSLINLASPDHSSPPLFILLPPIHRVNSNRILLSILRRLCHLLLVSIRRENKSNKCPIFHSFLESTRNDLSLGSWDLGNHRCGISNVHHFFSKVVRGWRWRR